ncbi:MAG: lysine--tRNA ligase, partial [Tannerella sp.]|nr:lysine--tRNA ligase [Tannerella sp.]
MNMTELSEQEIFRRNSLEQLRALGIEPYPAAEYKVTGHAAEIKENFRDDAEEKRQVRIAGRLM